VLGNHDQPRIASRIGDRQARVAAMLLLTLRGTPTLYYGEEIGMEDVPIPPEDVQDPYEKQQPGLGLGRDPERTPMPWDGSAQGGFSSGRSWLPLAPNHRWVNVATLSRDPESILTLYRRLIQLRRAHPALSVGTLEGVEALGDVLAYRRRQGQDHLLILLNLGHEACRLPRPDVAATARPLLSTTLEDRDPWAGPEILLGADEGLVLDLAPGAPLPTRASPHREN
jgi:alpha-glucosidase